jgi:hypothetical protein
MLRALTQVQRKRNLAELKLSDEEEPLFGFITYVDEDDDTFDIYTVDNVYNQVVVAEEGNVIMTETQEDAESIDFTLIKMTRHIGAIYSIIHDVSHCFPPERIKWLDSQKGFVYNREAAEREEELFEIRNRPKVKFTNKIAKTNNDNDDKEKVEESSNGNGN